MNDTKALDKLVHGPMGNYEANNELAQLRKDLEDRTSLFLQEQDQSTQLRKDLEEAKKVIFAASQWLGAFQGMNCPATRDAEAGLIAWLKAHPKEAK